MARQGASLVTDRKKRDLVSKFPQRLKPPMVLGCFSLSKKADNSKELQEVPETDQIHQASPPQRKQTIKLQELQTLGPDQLPERKETSQAT